MGHFIGNLEPGNLIFIVLYFLPVLVGLLRTNADADQQIPLSVIIFVDLLFGWTILGWLIAMALACRRNASTFAGSAPTPANNWQPGETVWGPAQTSTWAPAQTVTTGGEMPEPAPPCSCCQDQGQVCPSCFGNRGRWELPTTEHGVAQWAPCTYCGGSGRVQCSVCGKSGNGF